MLAPCLGVLATIPPKTAGPSLCFTWHAGGRPPPTTSRDHRRLRAIPATPLRLQAREPRGAATAAEGIASEVGGLQRGSEGWTVAGRREEVR